MKKAIITFITSGVQYNAGELYKAEDVKHCDPANFEDTTAGVVAEVKEVVAEIADDKAPATGDAPEAKIDDTADLDSNKGTE